MNAVEWMIAAHDCAHLDSELGSRASLQGGMPMRILIGVLVLFPIFATAQDLGPYHITSGNFSADGDYAQLSGIASGNGFTVGIGGGPEFLSYPSNDGGSIDFCFGCGLPGTDDGVGVLTFAAPNNPALAGLVQSFSLEGPIETGEVTVSSLALSGPGMYIGSFTLSDVLAFGPSSQAAPTEYVDVVGHGTATLDIGPPLCSGGICGGPPSTVSVDYKFAPELDPGSLNSALMLLGGGLLVLRGRRSSTPAK